jgi:hypothetical protein
MDVLQQRRGVGRDALQPKRNHQPDARNGSVPALQRIFAVQQINA